MSHVVDANVLIEAKKRYYRFGICPGYWNWLGNSHNQGILHSLDIVRNEILVFPKDDPLKEWVESCAPTFFKPRDEQTVEAFRKIAQWTANTTQYTDSAKNQFLATDRADGWLVAHAMAHGLTLVTDEQPSPDSKKRIMIPDACNAHGVRWINTFDFLEGAGAVFKL